MENDPDALFGLTKTMWWLHCLALKTPQWVGIAAFFVGIPLFVFLVVCLGEEPKKKIKPPAIYNPDVWSGLCYGCGLAVDVAKATSIHVGGKPPKYFCWLCRPKLPKNNTQYDT